MFFSSLCSYLSDPARFSDIDQIAAKATRMVEFLTEENRSLRNSLSLFERKVTKLQKVNEQVFGF